MSPDLSLIHDGKKYMWDGRVYATREEMSAAEEDYQKNNFEVWVTEEEGKFLIYTRRVVKQVPVTTQ